VVGDLRCVFLQSERKRKLFNKDLRYKSFPSLLAAINLHLLMLLALSVARCQAASCLCILFAYLQLLFRISVCDWQKQSGQLRLKLRLWGFALIPFKGGFYS
jgi:hypothetical protein